MKELLENHKGTNIRCNLISDKMPANLGYLYENLMAQMITATDRQLFLPHLGKEK